MPTILGWKTHLWMWKCLFGATCQNSFHSSVNALFKNLTLSNVSFWFFFSFITWHFVMSKWASKIPKLVYPVCVCETEYEGLWGDWLVYFVWSVILSLRELFSAPFFSLSFAWLGHNSRMTGFTGDAAYTVHTHPYTLLTLYTHFHHMGVYIQFPGSVLYATEWFCCTC